MDSSAEKLIQEIQKEVDGCCNRSPKNTADTNLGSRVSSGYQLIFGVSNSDKMAPGINVEFYKRQIIYELEAYGLQPTFLPFPYTQKNILIEVLQGLSQEHEADLNIERLLRDIDFNDSRPIYIIVTIVKYPVIMPISGT